jgi:NADPH:quinone reductase
VRIHAVGVNPVDTYLRSNTDNRGPKLPYTPGSDAAGVVEVVGSGVTQVKVGDRVYLGGASSGAYAELCLSDPGQLHPLPANATFAHHTPAKGSLSMKAIRVSEYGVMGAYLLSWPR